MIYSDYICITTQYKFRKRFLHNQKKKEAHEQ
jgi:hypothetical protein